MDYVARTLGSSFRLACAAFPAVLVTGPRQSGKTTFLRHEGPPDCPYVTFDDPLSRSFARDDPNGLLDSLGEGPAVLDEIQYVPDLLPYLKIRIDRQRDRKGVFLLTGSQQFGLMQGVSESLAGRIAILELLPFSLAETATLSPLMLEDALWRGGYPEPFLHPVMRDLWISSYLHTYVERDVRQVRNIQDLRAFEQFLTLCAAHHSQELHPATLARACGVSQPTIKSWVSALSASYVTALLPPWSSNLGKRVIRTPKLYFLDSALACTLTRQPSAAAALAGPLGGALFEGMVVVEALKAFAAAGRTPGCWFWRSRDGLEVDLLLELEGKIALVEIKKTATPKAAHVKPLQRLKVLLGGQAGELLLVCRVKQSTPMPGGALALPWQEWPAWLAERVI